jgi:hypothetical protein
MTGAQASSLALSAQREPKRAQDADWSASVLACNERAARTKKSRRDVDWSASVGAQREPKRASETLALQSSSY